MPEPSSFSPTYKPDRYALRPRARAWLMHIGLLLITLVTSTIAGFIFPFGRLPVFPELMSDSAPDSVVVIAYLPIYYLNLIGSVFQQATGDPAALLSALSFSVPLLFILASHEAGHYIACRIYKVDATLPFFIPTPPLIGPAGTLGAFIKIVSPIPSRRAVFDIGVAGPIAGFIALIPVAILAFVTMEQLTPAEAARYGGELYFSAPLFMKMLAFLFGIDLLYAVPNTLYFATWMGLLVTALNLIPSGQLDGGHANYAAFGPRVHWWTGRVAFVLMTGFALAGFYFYGSPSGFLIAVLLGVMLRVGHPRPADERPLDAKRRIIAVITVLIFIVSFVPFPIQFR